jgi:hypothetical protein
LPEYTPYAKWRMRTRKIPDEAVELILENYHNRRPAPKREGALPTVIYVGDYSGRTLKVYVERDTNPMLVTTAVWQGD